MKVQKCYELMFNIKFIFQVQDDVTETIVPENQSEMIYLTQENVLTVMQQAAPVIFQDNMMVGSC